jgi:hypothetical protein
MFLVNSVELMIVRRPGHGREHWERALGISQTGGLSITSGCGNCRKSLVIGTLGAWGVVF